MKILETSINWMEHWDNHPSFEMTVDKFPEHDAYRYRAYPVPGRSSSTLYVSDNQEFVKFLLHNPGDETGYAGRTFDLTMEDGSKVSIKGPWSSNSSSVHYITDGEVECVEAHVKDSASKYHCHGLNISVDLAKQICAENDAFLINVPKFRNVISLSHNSRVKPRTRKDYKTGNEYTVTKEY